MKLMVAAGMLAGAGVSLAWPKLSAPPSGPRRYIAKVEAFDVRGQMITYRTSVLNVDPGDYVSVVELEDGTAVFEVTSIKMETA